MLQENDLFPMELKESISSRVDFHARISAQQENKKVLKQSDQDYGLNSAELLATYDPDTQSWRTSQHSLVETTGDGLERFLETWPRSGLMQNGIAFSLNMLESHPLETGYGYVPTPTRTMWRKWWFREDYHSNLEEWGQRINPCLDGWWIKATWVEVLMGFPMKWTDLKDSETQ